MLVALFGVFSSVRFLTTVCINTKRKMCIVCAEIFTPFSYGPHCQRKSICKMHECRSVYIDYRKNGICSQIEEKKKLYFIDRFNTLHLHHSGIARLYILVTQTATRHSPCV